MTRTLVFLSACTVSVDLDGDGLSANLDCDDIDPLLGGPEVPYDGLDNDCDDATPDDDLDGDGSLSSVDCDDADAARHPAAQGNAFAAFAPGGFRIPAVVFESGRAGPLRRGGF